MRSFRAVLAIRLALALTLSVLLVAVGSALTLRAVLDRELDSSILNVASIQAASLADGTDGAMHFHEWDLTPDEAESVEALIRYAEVRDFDGSTLLRSRYMTSSLPVDQDALRRSLAGELVWTETTFNGDAVRSLYYPLERLGEAHSQHVLQIAAPLATRDDLVQRMMLFFLGLTLVVAAGSAWGGWWLAGRAVRPVDEIIDQAEDIEAGSLGTRIRAYGDTQEYRRLVEVLNTMLSRLETAFVAQSRFAADASHELRSPLTALRGEIEVALRQARTGAEYRAVLTSNLEEILRLSEITDNLLLLARGETGGFDDRLEEIGLASLVSQITAQFHEAAERKNQVLTVQVRDEPARALPVALIDQILVNLLDNAVKYSPEGGEIEVEAFLAAGSLNLTVQDTGPGLGDDPERLFHRFFRADAARTRDREAGVGLGLSISRSIVQALGGEIHAENRMGGGGRFAVRIPLRDRSTTSSSSPQPEPRKQAGSAQEATGRSRNP